jgi:redox-sensitive bicupin YhaK (pirin superfamily)
MLSIRPAEARGHANHGWLDTNYTFSFADYFDPKHMGFRALRVINEDRIAPGMGFGTHPHRDMEIITYVLEGSLAHKDSLGTAGVIQPGEVQRMSAGTGIRHSEFNASEKDALHLLQIWLMPNKTGIPPSYDQRVFAVEDEKNKLHLLASHDGRDGSFHMHSDADLYAAQLEAGTTVEHNFTGERHGWLQVARGSVVVNGTELKQGDGVAISSEDKVKIRANEDAEVLLFDLE